MKFKIMVTSAFASLDERNTIEHFMLWQGCSYIVEITPKALKYSKGTSQICIIKIDLNGQHNLVFTGFNQFYNWFNNSGLLYI